MKKTPNEKQKQVIENTTGNILLFASAGTGKTYTLASRVANIVRQGLAKAEEILCLTFTIKACGEMREDLRAYAGEYAQGVQVKTIHGFCYSLMREEDKRNGKGRSEATVCDEVDEERLLRSILSSRYNAWEYGVENEDGREFAIYQKRTALRDIVSELKHARLLVNAYTGATERDYLAALAYLRNTDGEKYGALFSYYEKYEGRVRDEAFQNAMERHAGRLCAEYEAYLLQSNQADYDDLIVNTVRYLSDAETAERYAKRYKYILVDEMQDTSLTEYTILRKLFANNNCMLCGDIFQTVYGWRGSNPHEIVRAFKAEFSPTVYTLSENYRSTQTLTRAALGFLQNSYPDFAEYFPEEVAVKSEEKGSPIRCYAFDNAEEEAFQIYNYIKKHKDGDVCVIARTNKYIASLYKRFEEWNAQAGAGERIDFFTVEENCQFYKKAVVKDVLAVLRFAINETDGVSLERLAEKYIKGVGLRTLEKLRGYHEYGVSASLLASEWARGLADPYAPLTEAFFRGEVVVYDTETTGLDLSRDEAVQISAIKINGAGEIVDTLDLFVTPTVPIAKGAYETHGFDEAYILAHGGLPAKEALAQFSDFVRGATLVGHNSLRFDSPLLKRLLKEQGLAPLSVAGEYDTLHLAKLFLPKLKNHKLSTLCERFGLVNENAHNALGDITATAGVLRALIEEYIVPTAEKRKEIVAEYAEKFDKFSAFISRVRAMIEGNALAETVECIMDTMRLESVYTGVGDQCALQDLREYFRAVRTADAENFLRGYLSDASLSGSQMDILAKGMRRIPIITVHQAKGCEFDTVLLAGADDNNFPAFFSQGTDAETEEKRVFYVAITRAKRTLILTRSAYRGRAGNPPTRYFYKIPEPYVATNALWYTGEES